MLFFVSLVSFLITIIAYPFYIKKMQSLAYYQVISEYSLEEFKQKAKTPTMGGIIFVLATLISLLILNFRVFLNVKVQLVILAFLGYALIGLVDDLIIIVKGSNQGLRGKTKLFLQLLLSIIFYLIFKENSISTIIIPFFNVTFDLGYFYSVLVVLMFVGSSNAVNLTDGMDGLAGGTMLIALLPFLYLAYSSQEIEVITFIMALSGSLLGYLMFNFKPAKVIMGDVGSLALGGSLAALAMVLKAELLLILVGGVFVLETLSVILQIFWVKAFKKRLFLYTPIHYTFRLKGYNEKAIVLGFYLLGFIFMLLGMGVILW